MCTKYKSSVPIPYITWCKESFYVTRSLYVTCLVCYLFYHHINNSFYTPNTYDEIALYRLLFTTSNEH